MSGLVLRVMMVLLLLHIFLMLILVISNLLTNILPGLDKLLHKKLLFLRRVKGQQQVHLKLILILIVLHDCIIVQQQHSEFLLHVLWLFLEDQVDLVHLLGVCAQVGMVLSLVGVEHWRGDCVVRDFFGIVRVAERR